MTEEQQKKELEIALTSYIALKHNQDECIGFIAGFKEALSLFAVSGSSTINRCNECSKEIESGTVFCSADCRQHYYH